MSNPDDDIGRISQEFLAGLGLPEVPAAEKTLFDNFASLNAEVDKVRADAENTAKLLNQLIDENPTPAPLPATYLDALQAFAEGWQDTPNLKTLKGMETDLNTPVVLDLLSVMKPAIDQAAAMLEKFQIPFFPPKPLLENALETVAEDCWMLEEPHERWRGPLISSEVHVGEEGFVLLLACLHRGGYDRARRLDLLQQFVSLLIRVE